MSHFYQEFWYSIKLLIMRLCSVMEYVFRRDCFIYNKVDIPRLMITRLVGRNNKLVNMLFLNAPLVKSYICQEDVRFLETSFRGGELSQKIRLYCFTLNNY